MIDSLTGQHARPVGWLWPTTDVLRFLLVAIGIGYPVVRAIIPGPLHIALLVPLGLLVLWAGWRLLAPRSTVQSPLGLPLLLGGATLLISSLFAIAAPVTVAGTLFDWVQLAVLLFLTIDLLAAGWRPQLFLWATLLASSAMLLMGIGVLAGWWLEWAMLWQPGEAWLPVGFRAVVAETHPNQLALIINIGLPLAIAALWRAQHLWQRVVWALWLLLAVVMLVYTSSRGAWLATFAIAASMVLLLAWSALSKRRWRRLVTTMLLAGGYAALFLALVLINLREVEAQRGIQPRTEQTTVTAAETVSRLSTSTGRSTFWRWAIEFFQERPLIGVGPEGFATRYATVEPHSRFFQAQHAHSIYLTLLSESGIFGVLALVSLGGTTLWLAWRGWRTAAPLLAVDAAGHTTTPADGRLLLLAGGASILGVCVHGMVEVPTLDLLGIALYTGAAALAVGGAWHAVARADTAATHQATLWRRLRRMHPLHIAIVLLALLAWGSAISIGIQRSAYETSSTAARAAAERGELQQALDRYEQTIRRYPWGQAAYSERATTLAWLALDNPELLPPALAAQETAQQADPTNRSTPVNRAALLLAMGQTEAA
ncbi:MAG: hypothetical protein HC914_07955, partial [Chloroflexaceae bacterium]|nr:hypothetical protein [Chloroflexaceae bacterium]